MATTHRVHELREASRITGLNVNLTWMIEDSAQMPESGWRLLMAKFSYDEIVKIKSDAKTALKRGDRAWIVAVLEDRQRFPLSQLPPGTVYSLEFEDGTALDVHEDDLELAEE